MADDDQPTAVLTGRQREYLRGEVDPDTDQHRRAMESRIRSRIRASISDLALILESGLPSGKVDLQQALDADDSLPMWALPGILFAWTKSEAPRTTLFSDEDPDGTDARTRLFDGQVVRGVETVFANDSPEYVVEDISNDLTIQVGPDLSDLPDDVALWKLKRDTLEQLFRAGEIDREEWADAMEERLRREENGELGTDALRPASELVDDE